MTKFTTLVALIAAGVLVQMCSCDYIKESILCDDIENICLEDGESYDKEKNETVCGNKEQFLNPTRCNCGTMCIKYMDEGDKCKTTSNLNFPAELCGPSLECIKEDGADKAYCKRNPIRKCIKETLDYEAAQADGSLGPAQYKPNCDEYGRYAGRQCSPGGTCYCVNTDGDRLFGEAPAAKEEEVDCECSTYWEDTLKQGLNLGLRCLTNGNFDRLQCTEMYCYCYNTTTGAIDNGPLPIGVMTQMPCYNSAIHDEEDYLNPCHKAQQEWDNQGDTDSIIIAESRRPECTPDGYYAAIQIDGRNAYCADIYGKQIETFQEDLYYTDTLTCNCARRRYVLEEGGFSANKPKCCPNGSYYPWQTRGLMAFCVDMNGNQCLKEVPITDITALPCYPSNGIIDPCVPSNMNIKC